MTAADFTALAEILPAETIITGAAEIERLSRDFYWYSPVLKRELADKLADAVVQPRNIDEVRTVLRFAYARRIPITVRGAGTGNYGQCIPTHGGLVVDTSVIDRVLEITADGVAVCEPGARLASVESAARAAGWELRCYPSTYVKAGVAGFCAGGSGGIGSITWGGLRENGTVHALTILTMEPEPREIRLEGGDIFKILHAWGTNGVIVQAELRLAPRTNWAQLAVAHATFAKAFDFAEAIAHNDAFKKRLVTCLEWPVPACFTPLQKWVPAGRSLTFLEIADDQLERLADAASNSGGECVFTAPWTEPRRGAQLSDYTWNHTTLWALKADPSVTYLQCALSPTDARRQMRELRARFGDELHFHIEFVRWDGVVSPGCLPIIKYKGDVRLREILDACAELEIPVANPHVNFLEGSGRWRPDDAKLIAKQQYDPLGLLNPGKMRGFAATLERTSPADSPVAAPQPATLAYGD
jgi:FAD/FMN-containing dehydrogenase